MTAPPDPDAALPDGPPPRLLLVEDDLDTAELIRECLEDHFGRGCVDVAGRLAEAGRADLAAFDLVLSDMNLPDGSGLDLLDELRSARPDLPVVFVTGEGILENAIAAIRRGAYDYVVKAGDYLFAIPLVVEKNLALWRIKRDNVRLHRQLEERIREVREKNDQLEAAVLQLQTMAATDPLTGLLNRRAIQETLDRTFAEAVRHGQDVACVMIDLDGFKRLNDAEGHQAGDRILRVAARVLKAHCRRSDAAGRFGGDEFIVVMPQTDVDTAGDVARRVMRQFEREASAALGVRPEASGVSMSVGVASLAETAATSPEPLIAAADAAMYAVKAAGKGDLVLHRAAAGRRPRSRAADARRLADDLAER